MKADTHRSSAKGLLATAVIGTSLYLASLTSSHGVSATPLTARDSSPLDAALQSCLSKTSADFAYPGSSAYRNESAAENTALPAFSPATVASPNDANAVSGIVKCVVAQGGKVKVSPRSGGHGYAGYSLGDRAQHVVVMDLKHLNSVTVDANAGTARVGAGVKLGGLAKQIGDKGFALPHGTCPQVGVAGHALGGGYGFATRAWGYLMDRVVSMELVDATGAIKEVSATSSPDLFWALRGAGSNNFGTVTAFTLRLEKAPTAVVNFAYQFPTDDNCAQALVSLQNAARETGSNALSPDFGGELLLYGAASGDGGACSFSGTYLGTMDGFKTESQKFLSRLSSRGVNPSSTSTPSFTGDRAWLDSLENIMGDLGQSSVYEPYYAESLIDDGSVSYNLASAKGIMSAVSAHQGVSGAGISISFDLLGPGSKTNDASLLSTSSFPHRKALFLSQLYAYGLPLAGQPGRNEVFLALDSIRSAVKQASSTATWGAYSNYIDFRLSSWAKDYYGASLDRLKSIKASSDPKTIFDFPQGLARA